MDTLPISSIRPDPDQPRKAFDAEALGELAASIREHGILEPIIVRSTFGSWTIIAGERRWRAAHLAGLDRIPVIVRDDLSTDQVQEVQITENVARADMTPIEEAEAFNRLFARLGTVEAVASKVGRTAAFVSRRLGLLRLRPEILDLLAHGQIEVKSCEQISRLEPDEQPYVVRALASGVLRNAAHVVAFVAQVEARRQQAELFDLAERSVEARRVRARLDATIQQAIDGLNALLDPRTKTLIADALEGDGGLVAERLRLLAAAATSLHTDVVAALAGRQASVW